MKHAIYFCLTVLILSTGPLVHAAEPEADEPDTTEHEKTSENQPLLVGVDLLPWVGVSSFAPDLPRTISLNLVGGISGGSQMFEASGGGNIATGPVRGVQVSCITNINFDSVDALQVTGAVNANGADGTGARIAGGANTGLGTFSGAKVAGGANFSIGDADGALVAGGANAAAADFEGAQVAGGANATIGDVGGAQVAGGANITGGDFQGAQVGGGANVTGGDLQGAQVAGGANASFGDVMGVQVAPVNISGGHVQGLQVGVVNVTRTADASIGLLNIHLDGYVEPELYASDDGLVMTGVRHGSSSFYSVYSLGSRFVGTEDRGPAIAASAGLGWRIELTERAELSLDVQSTAVLDQTRDWDWDSHFSLLKFRPLVSFDVLESLALFGGPTLTLMQPRNADPDDYSLIGPWQLNDDAAVWPGFTIGARLM